MKKWGLPKGWEWEILSDVVHINMGQSPPGESYNVSNEGIPFLQGNAEFGEIHPKNNKWTTSPTKKVSPGTILISVRAPIGDINIANNDYCIGRGLAGLSTKKCDLKFLYYYLKRIRPFIEDMGTGSTFKAISKMTIEAIPISLPPLETQQKIVAILDKAEEIKRIRAEANAQTQKLIQSVFLDIFGDPVKNPKEWRYDPIRDLCRKEKGSIKIGPFGSQLKRSELADNGYKVYGQENVIADDYFIGTRRISGLKFNSLKGFAVKSGDLLVTMMGTIGVVGIVPDNCEEGIIDSHLLRIRLDEQVINANYFKGILSTKYAKNKITQEMRGSIMNGLNSTIIKNISIPVPPIDLQTRYAKLIGQIENQIEIDRASTGNTLVLAELLTSKAFKGELVA